MLFQSRGSVPPEKSELWGLCALLVCMGRFLVCVFLMATGRDDSVIQPLPATETYLLFNIKTRTPKVCRIMARSLVFGGVRPLFYAFLGSREWLQSLCGVGGGLPGRRL